MLRAAPCLDRVMTPGIHLIKFSAACPSGAIATRNSLNEKGGLKGGKTYFTSHIVYTLLSNYFTRPPPLAINRQVTSLETLKSLFSCI